MRSGRRFSQNRASKTVLQAEAASACACPQGQGQGKDNNCNDNDKQNEAKHNSLSFISLQSHNFLFKQAIVFIIDFDHSIIPLTSKSFKSTAAATTKQPSNQANQTEALPLVSLHLLTPYPSHINLNSHHSPLTTQHVVRPEDVTLRVCRS